MVSFDLNNLAGVFIGDTELGLHFSNQMKLVNPKGHLIECMY